MSDEMVDSTSVLDALAQALESAALVDLGVMDADQLNGWILAVAALEPKLTALVARSMAAGEAAQMHRRCGSLPRRCPRGRSLLPRRRAGNQVLARSGTAPCRPMVTARATAVTITTTRKMTTLHNAMVAPAAVSWW